jgi:hypothetical protein
MSVLSSSFKFLALPTLLAFGLSACGGSSSSNKSPAKAPASSEAPKAKPTPKIQPPVAQPTLEEYETVHLDKEERVTCKLIDNSVVLCNIIKPEIAPLQDSRKLFRLKVQMGCSTRPLQFVLSAGDSELVLPLKQDAFGSADTRELTIEGPGPLQLKTLDPNALSSTRIARDKCQLSISLVDIK